MILLAILLPGVSFLLRGKILSGIIAIALQIVALFTFLIFGIGALLWLILATWAVMSINNAKNDARFKSIEKAILTSQGSNSNINKSGGNFQIKQTHVIAILVIVVAISILILTAGDASTYVDFNQAQQLASGGNTTPIHVVGQLKKDPAGNIIGLEKSVDNLSFSFVLVDDNKKEQKVYYNEPMPADFLRSEKVVVIGGYKNDQFVAKKILLKCPSKYQDQKLNAGV